MESKIKDLYEVTPLTMAIISQADEEGKLITYVIEENDDCYVCESPYNIVDRACKYYGSSLQGRLDGTRVISNITHKAPIAIDPRTGIYFFPTTSPKNEFCSWLSHSHVLDIVKKEYNCSEVIFRNGKTIDLEISHGSMVNQLYRTAQFRYSLETTMKSSNPFPWKRFNYEPK